MHAIYSDGVSASRHARRKRDDWPKLLDDVERDRVDVIWLWESSRGDRTLSSWALLLESCREHNVRICVESHGGRMYDMAVPREWRTMAEDGVDSAYESDKISERVTRAMAANAAAGKSHGQIPYGYQRKYEVTPSGKRVLVAQLPKPAEARVVKRIYRDIGRGMSLLSIARTLNEKGTPPPRGQEWTPNAVRGIALRACYAGKRSHLAGKSNGNRQRQELGTLTDGQWPALVSVEEWWNVRSLLTDAKRRTSRPGRAKHLLSMIATCGVCGAGLAVRYPRNPAGDYGCRDRLCVSVRQADMDDFIEALVFERLSGPDGYARFAADDNSAELQQARDELAEITAHHKAMLAMLRARKISAEAFAEVEPGVLADREKAEARVRELSTAPELRTLLGDPGTDIRVRWRQAPVVARRRVIRLLFASITLQRVGVKGVPIEERVSVVWRATAPLTS